MILFGNIYNGNDLIKGVRKSVSPIFGIMILIILIGFQFAPIEIQTIYAEPTKRIVGNFPGWESEKIDLIDYSQITDIMYFHISPNSDGKEADLDKLKSGMSVF